MWGTDRNFRLQNHCLAPRGFAEWCQTVIPRDGNFCPYLTAMIDTFSWIPLFIYLFIVYFVKNSKHNIGFVMACASVAHADRRELTVYLSRGTVKWYLQTYNNQVNLCTHTFDQSGYYLKGLSRKIVCHLSEQPMLWLTRIGMRRYVSVNIAYTEYFFAWCGPIALTHSGKSHDWVWISHLTSGGVRRKFIFLVKMVENLVGYARKGDSLSWPSKLIGQRHRYCLHIICSCIPDRSFREPDRG